MSGGPSKDQARLMAGLSKHLDATVFAAPETRDIGTLKAAEHAIAGMVLVPLMPTEAMWGGLARDIVMWSRFPSPTGKALHNHLKRKGTPIPGWLASEIEDVDHVPPKGTVAAVIYRAMIEACIAEREA